MIVRPKSWRVQAAVKYTLFNHSAKFWAAKTKIVQLQKFRVGFDEVKRAGQ